MMRRVIVLITALTTCFWLGAAWAQWVPNPEQTQKQGTYYPSQTQNEDYGSGYQTSPHTQQGYDSGNYHPDGSEYATGAPAPSGSNELFNTLNNLLGTVDKGMDLWKKGRDIKKGEYYGDPGYGSSGYTDTYWGDSGSSGYTDPSWGDSGSSGYTEPSGSGWFGTDQGIAPPPSPPPPTAQPGPVQLPDGLPQIAGTWQGTNGKTYQLYQWRRGFTWTIPGAKEQGTGYFEGKKGDWQNMQLIVSWQGQFGFGETQGKILQMQGDQATRIRWNNGIVFERY